MKGMAWHVIDLDRRRYVRVVELIGHNVVREPFGDGVVHTVHYLLHIWSSYMMASIDPEPGAN